VGSPGDTDGTGGAAHLSNPKGVAVDAGGNVYFVDASNQLIRKIDSAGVVTTLAGTPLFTLLSNGESPQGDGDGTGSAAFFGAPSGMAIDRQGNLFVTDGSLIRRVTNAGVVTTIAGGTEGSMDGTGTSAEFRRPFGVAVDQNDNLYVADTGNDTIRSITPTALVNTLAGFSGQSGDADGTGTAARFSAPTGVAVDAGGNVYVADSGNFTIRKITPAGVVTTLAGTAGTPGSIDGTGGGALFNGMNGIAVDSEGNVFVTQINSTVRKITSAGVVTTLAGTPNVSGSSNGSGAASLFNGPFGIAVDATGDMIVSDSGNDTIRERYAAADSQPSIGTQPTGQSVSIGSTATFSVTASGVPIPSYQWLFNGSYIADATNPTLIVSNVQAANLGSYSVVVTSSSGSITSNSVVLSSPGVAPNAPQVSSASYFSNISTRAQVQTGAGIEIAGFVVTGAPGTTEQVLIRASGPALDQFGITGSLLLPVLTLFDSAGSQIDTNSDWMANSNASQVMSAASSVGAFSFTATQPGLAANSALLLNLAPGNYTAQVTGAGATSGIALVEVYEIGTSSAQIINISTRAFVGTAGSVEIAGLVIRGSQPAKVLIRAVGPTLANFSVSGSLAQPTLNVVDASGNTVATNTGWSTNTNAAAIVSASAATGAFALPAGSADCALLLTLPPGSYTAIVSGVGGTSGIALVEAYQVP
jgi:sugar lactone lactonase YvrE